MSCTCLSNTLPGQAFACRCDQFVHPPSLNIGAGLPTLNRQIALFPAFRQAMLYALHQEELTDETRRLSSITDLNGWNARRPDDLGLMLLEMWAYVCDAISFYDQVIAHETYLRTATQRPSVRRLVGLLGYLPRPAVAALAQLAASAEGRQPVLLPAGTAFRSGAFAGNPPQVFELDTDTMIHPLTNQWAIRAPRPVGLLTANPQKLPFLPQTDLQPDYRLLLLDPANAAQSQAVQLSQVTTTTGADDQLYTYLTFAAPAQLAAGTLLEQLDVFKTAQTCGLWTLATGSVLANQVILDGLYRSLKANQYVLLSRGSETRWYRLTQVSEVIRQQSAGDPITINSNTFTMPGVSTSVTALTLDLPLNDPTRKGTAADWTDTQRAELTVHYQLVRAGTFLNEQKTTLAPTDPLQFTQRAETPADPQNPSQFTLTDRNERGINVGGQVDFGQSKLTLNSATTWTPELTLPVTAMGNIIGISRGETVLDERLGSGDASVINQSFTLKKKPLTYLPAANDAGFQTTLSVYVNGLRWTEVPTFYNQKPGNQIYIVRQTDEGDAVITFGDGIRGSRLPSGAIVVASYRFGAGLAAPPAWVINQIGKPVKGLQRVKNPMAAVGGADADTASGMQTYAPKSALLLGRAVSMADIEAATLAMAGVLAATVEWRWHGTTQGPVVLVWYVGDAGLGPLISARLHALTDPGLSIRVEQAQPRITTLAIDLAIDPLRVETDVLADVYRRLTDPTTGLLVPARLGIGKPLFHSVLFETVLAAEGAQSVRAVLWNGLPLSDFAQAPGAGAYVEFAPNSITLNGRTQP